MIRSRHELKAFLQADRAALDAFHGQRPVPAEVRRFQRRLRLVEYWSVRRQGRSLPFWIIHKFHSWRFHAQSIRCGYEIPPNVFGPGLAIAGRGTIVVHPEARIGARCVLHVDVVIGTRPGPEDAVPTIGADCTIGPGAKIFGAIVIGDAVTIGANTVVNRSFPQRGAVLQGAPARAMAIGPSGMRRLSVQRALSPTPLERPALLRLDLDRQPVHC